MGFEKMHFSHNERMPPRERVEALAVASESFGEKRQEEGFPVQTLTGRVDMLDPRFHAFRGDWQWKRDVAAMEKTKNAPSIRVSGADVESRLFHEGEQFELITAVILEKFLSRRFVVLRSSPHDDFHNGVDTILLDKKTGEIVCAFDEVGADNARLDEKEERAFLTNIRKGGARLDYGFRKNEDGKFVPASINNLPLFYLAISSKDLRSMRPPVFDAPASREEEVFFRDFLKIMINQARALQEEILSQMKGGGAALRGERFETLGALQKRARAFEQALREETENSMELPA